MDIATPNSFPTISVVPTEADNNGTSGHVLSSDMHAGDSADIPAFVGALGHGSNDTFPRRDLILVVVLWEHHDFPQGAIDAGYNTFLSTSLLGVATNLPFLDDLNGARGDRCLDGRPGRRGPGRRGPPPIRPPRGGTDLRDRSGRGRDRPRGRRPVRHGRGAAAGPRGCRGLSPRRPHQPGGLVRLPAGVGAKRHAMVHIARVNVGTLIEPPTGAIGQDRNYFGKLLQRKFDHLKVL